MVAKYLFLFILLLAGQWTLAQNDGLRLNVQLYSVQALTLQPGFGIEENKNLVSSEINALMISSLSGFQVSVSYEGMENDKLYKPEPSAAAEKTSYSKMNHLFENRRGEVEKIFTIDKKMQNIIRSIEDQKNFASDHLVLTLISQ